MRLRAGRCIYEGRGFEAARRRKHLRRARESDTRGAAELQCGGWMLPLGQKRAPRSARRRETTRSSAQTTRRCSAAQKSHQESLISTQRGAPAAVNRQEFSRRKTTLVSVPGGAGCAAVSPARLYLHLRRRGACGALFEPRHGCPLPRAPLLRRKQTSEIDSSFSPGRDPIGLCRERWDPKDPGTPPCRGTRSGPSAFSAGDLCARRSSLPLRRIVARGGSDVGAS
jgi:hypothetical protein